MKFPLPDVTLSGNCCIRHEVILLYSQLQEVMDRRAHHQNQQLNSVGQPDNQLKKKDDAKSDVAQGQQDPRMEFEQQIGFSRLFIKAELEILEITKICWDKCISTQPGNALDNSQKNCLSNCAQRYIDSQVFMRKLIKQMRANSKAQETDKDE
jgi:hypothetical protein